jgi:hypothetical protein
LAEQRGQVMIRSALPLGATNSHGPSYASHADGCREDGTSREGQHRVRTTIGFGAERSSARAAERHSVVAEVKARRDDGVTTKGVVSALDRRRVALSRKGVFG